MIKTLIQIYLILRWHKKTFPSFTCQGQKEKVAGEIYEFEQALAEYIEHPTETRARLVDGELADVVIASINLMRYKEMRELVKKKMKVNYSRSWNGGQHKEQRQ